MPAAESTIVFLPRFTTLFGASFTTQPLDVSQFASAQFQFGCGASAGSHKVYLEESLDCIEWSQGPQSPKAIKVAGGTTKFFSYGFRLRWFRLRVEPASNVTCWAEGILR